MNKDWLNEVLDNLKYSAEIDYPGPDGMAIVPDEAIAKAHKLISAQLIREKIKVLENAPQPSHADSRWSRARENQLADLTNQLKELEDDNTRSL